MNLSRLLDQSLQSFYEFWAARNMRERAMLSVAAGVVIFAVFYLLLIAPALSGRSQLNKNLPELRQQAARMQALATEAATLAEKNTVAGNPGWAGGAAPPPMSAENIAALLARNGLKAQSVMLGSDSAKVQLASVSFAGTLNWLDDMQKSMQLFVTEANIVALVQPDMVNATFTLRPPTHD